MTITKVDYDLIYEYVDSIIYESRVVNDAYDIIIDEIIELYRHANPNIIDEQLYLYNFINYTVKYDESFVKNFNLKIFVSPNYEGGEFTITPGETSLTKEGKLTNLNFIIRVDGNNGKMIESSFRETFAHELHHAYKFQQMVFNYNDNLPNSEVKRQNAYDENIFAMTNDNRMRILRQLFYETDESEYTAFCVETYEKILSSNNQINRSNYLDYIDAFKPQIIINRIDLFIDFIDKVMSEPIAKKNIVYEYNRFLKSKGEKIVGDNTACTLLKQFLIYKKFAIKKKMFKTIGKAFMEQDKNNSLKRSVLDNSKMVEKKITNEFKKLMEQYDIF